MPAARTQPRAAVPVPRRRRHRAVSAHVRGTGLRTASATLSFGSSLRSSASITPPSRLITITPTAVPSYGVPFLPGVIRPVFVQSTVTVPDLADGIYDS